MNGDERAYTLNKHTSFKEITISFIKELRIKQWIKNGFVFLGLITTLQPWGMRQFIDVCIGALLFCSICSSVYIFNDIMDVEKDRVHPKKKFRPIASGQIPIRIAMILAIVIAVITLILAYVFCIFCGIILSCYLVMNIIYSLRLKKYVFLDLFIISTGFGLRFELGILLLGQKLEQGYNIWFLVFIIFLTLFIGMGKRKTELAILAAECTAHRDNLKDYSLVLIGEVMPILTTCTLISYILYAVGTQNLMVLITIPLVLYGILRYLYITACTDVGGKPENIIFCDKPTRICILAWLVVYMCIKVMTLF